MSKNIRGFTMVELLASTAIMAFLAVITVPAVSHSLSLARTTQCAGNIRQLGLAVLQYAAEHNLVLPATAHQSPGESWTQTLQPYASGTVTFKCPSDENKQRERTYVMNDFLTPNPCGAPFLDLSRLIQTQRHQDTILYFEAVASANNPDDHFHFSDYYQQEIPPAEFSAMVAVKRHSGRANYLFVDGHVETLGWQAVQSLLNKPGSRFVDPTRN